VEDQGRKTDVIEIGHSGVEFWTKLMMAMWTPEDRKGEAFLLRTRRRLEKIWRLENTWRKRASDAWYRYRDRSDDFHAVWKGYFNDPMSLTADGARAIHRAREAESQALAEYVRVLKIYTDFIISGKTPPKE
jgi:hypothetical protein